MGWTQRSQGLPRTENTSSGLSQFSSVEPLQHSQPEAFKCLFTAIVLYSGYLFASLTLVNRSCPCCQWTKLFPEWFEATEVCFCTPHFVALTYNTLFLLLWLKPRELFRLNKSEDCKCPTYLIHNQIVFAVLQRCSICIHQLHKAHAKSSLRLIPSCKQKSVLGIVLFMPMHSIMQLSNYVQLLYLTASHNYAMAGANSVILSRKN